MLLQKLMGANAEVLGLVGYAQTKVTTSTNSVNVDLSGLDIRSGDLGIFICGFHSGSTNTPSGWTADYAGSRVESAHITFSGGETTTTVTGVSMDDGAAMVFVYRGFVFTSTLHSVNTTGMPNPPSQSVSFGDKVFIAGFLDDDILIMTAPSEYSLILADNVGVQETGASYAAADRDITSTGTEDPAAFGGGGDDVNLSFTYVLSPA
jgi:hypothetical protein